MTIAQQLNRVSAGVELSTKAREFCNLARVVALSRGNHADAQRLAQDKLIGPTIKTIVAGSHRVYEMRSDLVERQKAAVAAGTTVDSGWALPLAEYQVLASAFLESLRQWGCFDRLLPSMRRVPFRTRIGASTTGISGTTVGQGQVKPISKLTLSGTQIDERKAVAILVVTDELAKFGDVAAGNLFSVELSNAVAEETDAQFVTVLISGATSIGSSGVTAENVRSDLRAMLAAVTTSARSALFLLVTSSIAKVLAVLHDNTGGAAFPTLNYNGGSLAGIQVVVSDGVPASTMLLVDAQQVAAASETVQLAATSEAIVALELGTGQPCVWDHPHDLVVAAQPDRPESRTNVRSAKAHHHRRLRPDWRGLCR